MTRSKKNTTGKPTTATQLSPMMTVAEVADLLGFGQNFVYRLVSKPGFPAVKVGNSYRIFREGLMEWLDAQKVNNTPEVLHNMWDPEVAPYPAGGRAGKYDYRYEKGDQNELFKRCISDR